ncbi:hypothetical protein [Acinetobacter terrae]|uniref:hypothetical protein n=1 Tax=Acinetobacter terrae TaxID=2731247 RepID=UPI001D1733C8|nr:hypothetical protein [Acinetobacter terrae]
MQVFLGAWLVSTIFEILDKAKNNLYPIDLTTNMIEKVGSDIAENFIELVQWLNLNLNWLDEKILQAEYQMMKDGVFNPELVNPNLDVQTMKEQFMNMKNFSKNGYSQIIENFLKRRLNK